MYFYNQKQLAKILVLFIFAQCFQMCLTVASNNEDVQPYLVAPPQKMYQMKFNSYYKKKIDTSIVDPNYAALCVITKNEYINDIQEFLEYHFKIGFGRIYLIDTGTDNSRHVRSFEVFREYLEDGRLFYSYWNYGPPHLLNFNMQLDIYRKCAETFADNHVWFGYIDIDEFIILRDTPANNIQQFLQKYEGYGALSLNWVVLGPSGFKRHHHSTLLTYTKCFLHARTKTIVNVRYWNKVMGSSHSVNAANFLQDHFSVDENFEMVKNSVNRRFAAQKIALFHYATKSLEDYKNKLSRGASNGFSVRRMIFYQFVENNANYTCSEGVQLAKQLLKK